MEEKKPFSFKQLGKAISDTARSGLEGAKDLAQKTKNAVTSTTESFMQSIDQTGDGKFDVDDITELRRQRAERDRQAKLRRDLDELHPVFANDLADKGFFLPQLIRLTEMDKKHALSTVCKGSIGHETLVKDLRIVTVYSDQTAEWGLQFYPDRNQDFYFVNPTDSSRYIGIDHFFDYMRQARVSELQRIAQDLGAKYFKVTMKEMKKSLFKRAMAENAAASGPLFGRKSGVKEHVESSFAQNDLSDGEIAAETTFAGHAPRRPTLVYYKNEPQIQALVDMRMDYERNGITEQHLSLRCMHSSGITEKVAANIDAAFSAMKITGNTTFTSEAQNEVRQIFEYDILF